MAVPIGTRIARRRQALRMTQEELAAKLGVAKSTVANWETGKHFPKRKLGAVEQVLGVRLDDEPDEPEVPSEILDAIYLAYPGDENAAMRAGFVEAFRQQVRSGTGTSAAAGAAAGPGRHRRAV